GALHKLGDRRQRLASLGRRQRKELGRLGANLIHRRCVEGEGGGGLELLVQLARLGQLDQSPGAGLQLRSRARGLAAHLQVVLFRSQRGEQERRGLIVSR